MSGATRTVTIPARAEHAGIASVTLTLSWRCLHCGGPRGEPFDTISYDGSRRLSVHGWRNPCGHVETYREVRESVLAPPPSLRGYPSAVGAIIDNRPANLRPGPAIELTVDNVPVLPARRGFTAEQAEMIGQVPGWPEAPGL